MVLLLVTTTALQQGGILVISDMGESAFPSLLFVIEVDLLHSNCKVSR